MIVNNRVLFDSQFDNYLQRFTIVNKKREYYYQLTMRKIDCCYMVDDNNNSAWLAIDKRKVQEISHKSVFYISDLDMWIKPKYFGGIHIYKNSICIEVEDTEEPEDLRE